MKDMIQSVNGIGLIAYPNPAKESVTIEYSDNSIDGLDIDMYDLIGQKVKSLETYGLSKKGTFDISDIPQEFIFYRYLIHILGRASK